MDSFLGKYFLVVMAVLIGDYDYGDYAADDAPPIPSKTRARTCDMEIELFEMQPMEPEPIKGKLSNCSDRSCDKQFIVQPVLSSNLVVLAVFTDCNCTSTSGTARGGSRQGHLLQPEQPAATDARRLHQLPCRGTLCTHLRGRLS
ncbi:hypothetical protein HPB49_004323 [Dermacentor silvarum]|uniref:Uncharacterized protein n=1 Tax=Dermacentor silvarum TaxID=543639 RepID=A0ACB8DAY8_DERSI|nr:hypothetical protein HPB49_004323 [Dermacentor silvarum]